MNRTVLALLLAIPAVPTLAESSPAREIFDGRTLAGWSGDPSAWRVENGAIVGEIADGARLANNQFLYWEGTAGDFELDLEFRIEGVPGANSGIQYRSQRDPDGHARGYQADLDGGATWLGRIYDEHGRKLLVERGTRVAIAPDGRKWVDEFAPVESFKNLYRPDEWNTYRITARASHVEIWINGRLVSVLDDHQTDEADLNGSIAFQLHSGTGPVRVQFRNIRLTDLGETAAPPRVAPAAPLSTLQHILPSDATGRELNLGFETGTLDDWTADGDAWTDQPMSVPPANTETRKSDGPTAGPGGLFAIAPHWRDTNVGTGRLTSAPFRVTHRWASYLTGGDADINRHRVELLSASNDTILHSAAAGMPDRRRRREVVDLQSVLGKDIRVRLVDDIRGGQGHLVFDDFVFHDRNPAAEEPPSKAAERLNTSPVLWHLQPNPAAPSPVAHVDAQKVVRDMKLQPGFAAELIAAEPDVHQPIAFAIDERGRLWVAEAYSYPTKQPEGQGKDRVVIFEDGDGDGAFETRKIFAEGLNLVSGLEVGFGGVWVGAAPELLFIPDANRDDRPDGPAQVLLDGWGYQDTHETMNSFTWGPDGWLYGLQGVFTRSRVGKPGTPDDERIPLRAGVWRYHPVRHEFEVFAHGGSNQWGLDFNEAGHLFMTHCRSFHAGGGTTHVIRHGHYWNQINADHAPFISNTAPDFAPALRNFLPSSARYDSGEGGAGKPGTTAVYGGHSHVGTMIYLGDNWPDIYRDHLFTHNLHGHQVNHQHSVRQGSGYETFHAGHDILFTPDPTFVPVDLQYGPDGAVYMIDWCDHQHCHSARDDVWERGNGRIYRVTWAATWKPTKVDLHAMDDAALAALHTHRNEWYVRNARRLLQERAAVRPLDPAALAALRRQATVPEISQRVRASLTLHAVQALGAGGLEQLLRDPSDILRAWAVQFATERSDDLRLPAEALAELAANDPSPTVRLALASALPKLPTDLRWRVGAILAGHGEDAADRFLPPMIWFGLAPLVNADLPRALELAENTALPTVADSIYWQCARTAEGRQQLATRLTRLPAEAAARTVRVMAFSLRNESSLPMPEGWPELSRQFADADEAVVSDLQQLSAQFGDETVLAIMRARLADPAAPVAKRESALELLKRVGDRAALPVFVGLLADDQFRGDAIPLVSASDDPSVAPTLLRLFPDLSAADRNAALATLTSRPVHTLTLLEAVVEGSFDRHALNALHVRQMRNLQDPAVDRLLDRVWKQSGQSSAEQQATIERLRKAYREAPLWAYDLAPGRKLFQNLCASCHMLDGEGGRLGPDLTGSWLNGLDYYLESIVDPNAVIGLDYQLNIVTLADGSVLSGVIDSETDTTLVVRTPTETVSVPKERIQTRQLLEQSLMPPGLLEGLPERDVIHLLKLLLERRG